MPSSVQTVVVTGAGGFVGTELVKQLLANGYIVRATVRKIGAPQYEHLATLGKVLAGSLEFFEADLTEEGSFDSPIEGATYVFHTASPIDFGTGDAEKDQENIVDPAVNGTATIIRAAAKHKSVKRVVITSSIAAVTPSNQPFPKEGVYDAQSMNKHDTADSNPYFASKSAAEREARALADELGVDVVTIHPALVVGPVTSKRRGLSQELAKKLLEGGKFEDQVERRYIDVRDVVEAHIRAAEYPKANGRYLLAQPETANWKEIADAVRDAFPDWDIHPAKETPKQEVFDISKVENDLGMRLRPITTAFKDAIRTTLSLEMVTSK